MTGRLMADFQIKCSLNEKGLLRLEEQLRLVALPPKERKIFVNKVGGDIRKKSRRNITRRKTVDGPSMEPRKKRAPGRHKKKGVKMFRGLSRFMAIIPHGRLGVDVTWKNPVLSSIAHQHQHGSEVQSGHILLKKQLRKEGTYVRRKDSCPRWLAKELSANGYKHRIQREGKKDVYKRVSIKFIMDNLTRGQASFALQILTDQPAKEKWMIPVPARPFLGIKPKEADQYTVDLIRTTLKQIKRA